MHHQIVNRNERWNSEIIYLCLTKYMSYFILIIYLNATGYTLLKLSFLQACRYLLEAAKSGDVNSSKILVNCTNENCTGNDECLNTPLIYAAINGHAMGVRVLLEGGANIDRPNDYYRLTAFTSTWKNTKNVRVHFSHQFKVTYLNCCTECLVYQVPNPVAASHRMPCIHEDIPWQMPCSRTLQKGR
jgi:hypothetical protein